MKVEIQRVSGCPVKFAKKEGRREVIEINSIQDLIVLLDGEEVILSLSNQEGIDFEVNICDVEYSDNYID